ncbi:MAG: transposase [Bacteroidota bacterium]|nr:transposase [Bacteroidota bacterium]
MKQEPFEPGNYYHVFNRGNNKENIFKEPENYNYFLKLMKKYLPQTCETFAYCLLPNHFHILLKIKDKDLLPVDFQNGKKKIHQAFSNLFNAYSKSINKKYNRTGSLFQEHLHRINIDKEEYLRELILYIHLNPEKHKIDSDFTNYLYSSYKTYLSSKPSLLERKQIIQLFDNEENFIFCHQNRKIKLDLIKEVDNLDY